MKFHISTFRSQISHEVGRGTPLRAAPSLESRLQAVQARCLVFGCWLLAGRSLALGIWVFGTCPRSVVP
jgi:hypothetical protein